MLIPNDLTGPLALGAVIMLLGWILGYAAGDHKGWHRGYGTRAKRQCAYHTPSLDPDCRNPVTGVMQEQWTTANGVTHTNWCVYVDGDGCGKYRDLDLAAKELGYRVGNITRGQSQS